MKNYKMSKISKVTTAFAVVCMLAITIGCEDSFEFELPEANSQADTELPNADFTFTQNILPAWKQYEFKNISSESTKFEWDFGTGDRSEEENPIYTFAAGEGTYSVTLKASDANGESSTITKDVVVIEPDAPDVADPILVNFEFDKLAKSSGSDCSCAGWINKSIGEQGESSSGNGGSDNVVKFDNNEPDHVYQEFAVEPNADYTIAIATSFKSSEMGSFPSMLEIRVLAGTGYIDGYTPVYYTETVEFPQDGWGYTTVEQVEDEANNLLVKSQSNPDDDGYLVNEYRFNSGANNSVALFIRGTGGDSIGDYLYTGGDEEIRADYVIITADN